MGVKFYSETGKSHKERNILNQDRVKTYVTEYICILALSDGAGSAKYADIGADIVCDECCAFFQNDFQQRFSMENKRLKHYLISRIYKELIARANVLNTDISQFGATLLCACYERKTGRLMTVHLGDGVIAISEKGGNIILSKPLNGITKRYTYLTTSISAISKMRIAKYTNTKINNILLMSDGTSETVCKDGIIDKDTKTMIYNADLNALREYSGFRTRDDYSAIAFTVEENDNENRL